MMTKNKQLIAGIQGIMCVPKGRGGGGGSYAWCSLGVSGNHLGVSIIIIVAACMADYKVYLLDNGAY
jgi:hypothetical protein